ETCYVPSDTCIQHAYKWHKDLCQLLLSAYSGLFSYYATLLKEIPDLTQVDIEELMPGKTLSQMCNQLQHTTTPSMCGMVSTDGPNTPRFCSHQNIPNRQKIRQNTRTPLKSMGHEHE
ncbi:hypothetical protein AB205_0208810, partial [Aquarana catesbeiana]